MRPTAIVGMRKECDGRKKNSSQKNDVMYLVENQKNRKKNRQMNEIHANK